MKDACEDYEPFGDEWKKEMMKMRKCDIINMFSMVGKEYVLLKQKEEGSKNDDRRDER